MSTTHKLTYAIASDSGGTPLSGTQSAVGIAEIAFDQQYGAALVDQLLTVAFTAANVQSIFLLSDKGLKIETNNPTTPINTINLKPGDPFVWDVSTGYYPNPFTSNVTAFYITTTVAARLQGKILTV